MKFLTQLFAATLLCCLVIGCSQTQEGMKKDAAVAGEKAKEAGQDAKEAGKKAIEEGKDAIEEGAEATEKAVTE